MLLALAAAASSSYDPGSERYDPTSHKPKHSAGCGTKSPYKPGKSVAATAKTAGVKWTYRVYVPKAYDESTPMPLIGAQYQSLPTERAGARKLQAALLAAFDRSP